jgi:hypothetical protein
MSKGGGSGATQTQTSQTQLPGWVNQASMQNWDLATQTANQLMSPYGGQRVADMTPGMQQLINMLQGNATSYQSNPAMNAAMGTTTNLLGYDPSTVTPQTLAGANLQPYMNPYTQNVIDPTMKLMEQSRQQALMGIGDQATQAKAFGGSRQGVAEGVTNAQSELQKGQFVGGLLGQNYTQAQQGAQYDIGQNLAAQQFNSQMGLAGAQFQGNMANQLAGMSTQQQNQYLQAIQAAMGGQGLLQQQQQQQLSAAQQYYNEQRQQPLDVLGIRQSALSQSPYGQTTTTTRPGPETDPWGQALGGAATLAGIAGKVAPLFATGAVFSDRREKTDIKKIGVDGMTGLPLYAYRYKDDPKTYPKVVGPMAQDVVKKFPEAVKKVGGKLAINLNMLGMAA